MSFRGLILLKKRGCGGKLWSRKRLWENQRFAQVSFDCSWQVGVGRGGRGEPGGRDFCRQTNGVRTRDGAVDVEDGSGQFLSEDLVGFVLVEG